MKAKMFSVQPSNLLIIVLLVISDIATAANFEPDKIFISGEISLIIYILFNVIVLWIIYITGKINLIRLILTGVLILISLHAKFVHNYSYFESFIIGLIYTITAYLGTVVYKDRTQIVEKIHDFKKKGFKSKIKLSDGNILLIGPRISQYDNLFHYSRVVMVDQNYNQFKTDMFDGIGDDITDKKTTLIRVIKKFGEDDWRVGFINKYSGIIIIEYKYKEACRFLKNCDLKTKKEKVFARVLSFNSDIPLYINEEGIVQKVFCD